MTLHIYNKKIFYYCKCIHLYLFIKIKETICYISNKLIHDFMKLIYKDITIYERYFYQRLYFVIIVYQYYLMNKY